MLPQVSEETGYPLLALPLRLGSAYRCCGHEISSFSVASVSNIKTDLFANSIKYIELALLFCEFIINHFSISKIQHPAPRLVSEVPQTAF